MKLRHEANKKGRKASKYKGWPEHHSHGERKKANKLFHKTLEHTKRQHWRDWLEKADDPDIWTTHKYTSSPAGMVVSLGSRYSRRRATGRRRTRQQMKKRVVY